ncbi:MAG TPA: 6-bladed beta-propeller [Candidatus Aminicenantes bacterium]|nr:6-bladed beta-propeller [Candidatus Aminicenantes bacterium]
MKPKVMVGIIFWFVLAFSLRWLPPTSPSHFQAEEIKVLKKVGEIGEKFGEGEEDYFWHIDDLCCDDEGNLYVADSGWNKIFKFSPEGKFLGSFGREGQGPGEFLGQPIKFPLKISFGNDGFLYIIDTENKKILKFNKEGVFYLEFYLPYFLYDSATVTSRGDIYILSKTGKKLISHYDRKFNIKNRFFSRGLHFRYPYFKLPWKEDEFVDCHQLQKVMTKDDNLVILSNYSLNIYLFNDKNKIIKNFRIYNNQFEMDFKKRLKNAVEKKSFIIPFNIKIDNEGNILLLYSNTSKEREEIYKYDLKGNFLGLLILPDKTLRIYDVTWDNNFYVILNKIKIGKYI